MLLIRISFYILLFSAVAVQASSSYQINQLGFLPGDGYSWASHINNKGEVVGSSASFNGLPSGEFNGFLWTSTSGIIGICVKDQFDQIGDISNNSQIAGTAYMGLGPSLGVLRKANGELVQLNAIGIGVYSTFGYAVNDAGWVVGTSGNYAVLWPGSSTPQVIGGSATSQSYAIDINNNGSIAWHESLYENYQWIGGRSYVWNAGVNTILQTLSPGDNCQVAAINDAGIAVGNSGNHAVVWGSNGAIITDLGIGWAKGINNSGQIVGTADDSAWLWSEDGALSINLGSLAGADQPSEANDINDSGWIVGAAGYNEYQNMEAVLWEPVPVPEPSSLLTLVSLMTGVAALTRRRKS